MDYEKSKPKVLIVGAGMGGLSLAAILERAHIPYEIFEKASVLKPLGSAICIGPGVMPMFIQLGVMDQIVACSKRNKDSFIYNEKMEALTKLDYSDGLIERFGWPTYIISRPKLHDVLLSLVPRDKIHLSKRVLSTAETEDGVIIRTSDRREHHGDILVGADSAYSGVRQSMYEYLSKQGKLPAVDKKPLQFQASCLTFTTAEKTVCWMVIQTLDKETSRFHDNFRASEWGPEAADMMCKEVADFPIRPNMSVGDLINMTPKEVICKVMLEEKIFHTWHAGRTVLLGDG
ncbi:hypothetical protein EDD11_004254 [Mortierella claussenii]|nr:hypothetical protein EDD11_004254 [Mortierella claussenii]